MNVPDIGRKLFVLHLLVIDQSIEGVFLAFSGNPLLPLLFLTSTIEEVSLSLLLFLLLSKAKTSTESHLSAHMR